MFFIIKKVAIRTIEIKRFWPVQSSAPIFFIICTLIWSSAVGGGHEVRGCKIEFYYIKVSLMKNTRGCYSNFKNFRNKWARIFYVSVFKFTFFVLQRDSDNDTALHNAVLSGNFDIVKLLVKNLIKINVYNHNGYTPLQLAMEKGHSKVGSKEFYPPVS